MKINNLAPAEYIEKVVVQDPNDKDFIKFSNTRLKIKHNVIAKVLETDLKNKSIILNKNLDNKEVMLIRDTDIEKSTLGIGDSVNTNTLNVTDIFGDGSCVATYPFDGNVNDLANERKTAVYSVSYGDGRFGQAIRITNGSLDDHTLQFDSGIEEEFADEFSVSFWFKQLSSYSNRINLSMVATTKKTILNTDWKHRWEFSIDPKNMVIETLEALIDYDKNVQYNLANKESIELNKWYFVSLSYRNNDKFYGIVKDVNGNVILEKTINNPSGKIKTGFALGRTGDYNNDQLVDQVRVFNRALTPEEIEVVYKEQITEYKYNLDITKPIKLVTEPFDIKIGIAAGLDERSVPDNPMELIRILDIDSTYTVLREPINGIVKVNNDILIGSELKYVTQVSSTVNKLDIFGDNSCIAAYTLDGNANDLSGKHNGVWQGTEQYDIGKYGKAAKFDGKSYLVGKDMKVGFNEGNWAISLWAKPFSFSSQQGTGSYSELFRYVTDNGADNGLGFDKNHHIALGFYNDYRLEIENNKNIEINPNEWNHIVLTLDSQRNVRVYLNTELIINGVLTGISKVTNNMFHIGKSEQDFFVGLLDQVRIFNRGLTDEDVSELYTENSIRYVYNNSDLKLDKKNLFLSVSKPVELKVLEKGVNYIETIDPLASDLEVNDTIIVKDLINNSFTKALTTSKKSIPVNIVNVLDVFGDNSCIAAYTLDGNANDLSGKHNGVWQGTEQYDIGKYGKAAKFDGKSVIKNDNFNIGKLNTVTFTFWASSTQTTSFKIIGSDSVNNDDFALEFDFGKDFHPYFRSNLQNTTIVPNAFINDGSWHFYVITFDNNGFKIWRDTNLLEDNGSQPISTTSSLFRIGNVIDPNKQTGYYNGLIDQVRVFNRTLTDKEILRLYNEQGNKYTLGVNLDLSDNTNIYVPDNTKLLNVKTVDIESDTLTLEYEDYIKRSRAVRRRIQACGDVEILPPFTTDVDKLLK